MNKGLKLDIICYASLLGVAHFSKIPELALGAVALSSLYMGAVLVKKHLDKRKQKLAYIISHC